MDHYAYILKCADGTFYCGWTNDLRKRLKAHNAGKGAKYTRGRGPVELCYWESFATKEEAMRREYALKQLSREEKKRLVEGFQEKTAARERETCMEQRDISGIVCFDLDHTLLDNEKNEICASAMLAIKKLREAGYIIAIASGRDMDNYYSYMFRDLVKPEAIIHQNGTRVAVRKDESPYDPEKGAAQYKLIFDHFMEPALLRSILQYAEAQGLCVGTTVDGKDYFTRPELKTEADKSYNKFLKRRFVPAEGLLHLPVRALSYVGRDAADKEAFLKHFPTVRLLMFSSGEGADMVEACCSKAEGLKHLCAYYKVPLQKTWAFGDSENDIEILREAGCGIAVGNAMEETKEAADYVTEDIREDGIWKACTALGLIRA